MGDRADHTSLAAGGFMNWKGIARRVLSSRWPRRGDFKPGYTILLPTPADMPFLLELALESVAALDTTHCHEILVIADGRLSDDRPLRELVESCEDRRVRIVPLPWHEQKLMNLPRADGGANYRHWWTIVKGIGDCETEYVFLHDLDAFPIDSDAVERQYLRCRNEGWWSLGVTARWDPFFTENDYQIPGTWELMFSAEWARRKPPYALKGAWHATPLGPYEFDTMLHRQYIDYPSGRIGILQPPPDFVHFSAAIVTFRMYQRHRGEPVVDELFRLLFLALLESVAVCTRRRLLPRVEELAMGLRDLSQRVRYSGPEPQRQYPQFRRMIDDLCRCPGFREMRGEKIREMLEPFDRCFGTACANEDFPPTEVRLRKHALGQDGQDRSQQPFRTDNVADKVSPKVK